MDIQITNWMDKCLNKWMDDGTGWMDIQITNLIDGWMDGWMDGYMYV